ncbi:MAG: hypothetical protein PHR96_05470, partial [Clostridia bacterium]|nr:hypothetical protein [Clostridia bacterium]
NEQDFRSMDLARFWKILFKQENLTDDKKVVEICTGLAPKVIYALALLNFKGQYYSFDFDKKVTIKLKSIFGNIKTGFSGKFISDYKQFEKINGIDYLVLNHGVDDLFLDTFCKLKKIRYCDYLSNAKSKTLLKIIQDNDKIYLLAIKEITNIILDFSNNLKKDGFLMLSNYPPLIDIMRKDKVRIKLLEKVFDDVIKNLKKSGFEKKTVSQIKKVKSKDNKLKYWVILINRGVKK